MKSNGYFLFPFLGLFLIHSATAADSPWFISADIGASSLDAYSHGISALADPGGTGGLQSFTLSDNRDDDQGFRLTVGHQFTEHWAVEFSYLDLGEFEISTTTSQSVMSRIFGAPPGGLTESTTTILVNEDTRRDLTGLNFNLVGRWQLLDKLSLLARAGVFSYDGESYRSVSQEVIPAPSPAPSIGFIGTSWVPTNTVLTTEEGGSEISYGLGLNYRLTDAVEAKLEYQFFKDISSADVDIITVGLSYRF